MPLYEYRCETCGELEEKLEGFEAPTEHDCPQCGASAGMRRKVSLTSFTLAGGGWMAQGYGKGAKAKDGIPVPPKAEAPAPAAAPAQGCAGGCACHAAKPAK
jgi:putative FmdB family regulatory protein